MRSISKVLVVGAVAGACGYAAAGTISAPSTMPSYGLESALAVSPTASITNLGLVPGTAGTPQTAQIAGTLTFATNALAASTSRLTFTSNRTFGSVDIHGQSFTCSAGPNLASIVFQLSSTSTSSALIYDAASRGTGDLTNASCTIPSIAFLASSFASAGDISLAGTVVNINTGFTLDTFASAKIASVGSTLTFTVASSLDAVIDVQSNRLTFASGTDAALGLAYSDVFTLSQQVSGRATVAGGYTSTFALTLTAGTSFGFLQEPTGATGAGSCSPTTGSGQAATGGLGAASLVVSAPNSGTCNVLVSSHATTALTSGSYSIGLGREAVNASSASASQFAPQSYTFSYVLSSGARTLASAAASAAGSWTLNGTTTTLQYVPVATDTNLQVLVSNTSASPGNLTFVAYNHSGQTCTGDLGAVAATANSSFGGQLRSALLGTPAAGTTTDCSTTFIGAGSNARASVVLTSTTPASSTRVHSGFSKSDGVSRQIIVNSGN